MLDLPEVVDMMLPELNESLTVDMVKGDFTEGLPKGPFDLVYLSNICHIYGEKENRKLFQDAADSLKSGGLIVIRYDSEHRDFSSNIYGKHADKYGFRGNLDFLGNTPAGLKLQVL
ncbi:MAG: class I SAM-dependent methyltransferase [Dehalobacterium sp.]